MIFSKDDIKTLETLGCVKYFEQTRNGFKSATRLSLSQKVEQIYNTATKTSEKTNFSCNVCTFKLWKKVADLYFKSKEHYSSITETQIIEPQPKKAGRPKKK